MLIDDLLEEGLKLYKIKDFNIVKKRMFEAAVESIKWQFEKCALYRNLCKQKNFDPRRDLKNLEDLKNIPYLTTANFKGKSGRPKELLCVPEDQIHFWSLSSGTSGDPSMVGRDWTNIKRTYKAYKCVLEFLNIDKAEYVIFFTPPIRHHTWDEKGPIQESAFTYFQELIMDHIPLENRLYAFKVIEVPGGTPPRKLEVDGEKLFGLLNKLSGQNKRIWLGGSVPLCFKTLTEYYNKTGKTFKLGGNCYLAVGGGWKTFSGEAVNPEIFWKNMSEILGIPQENVRDVYTFSETDICFPECKYHNKHLFPWYDVIVRDTETLEPVKKGEKGLINVINPIAYSYAGVSIMQDDIVRITHEDDCPCGIPGKTIEMIGRAKGAEAKGCGAQIAEMGK